MLLFTSGLLSILCVCECKTSLFLWSTTISVWIPILTEWKQNLLCLGLRRILSLFISTGKKSAEVRIAFFLFNNKTTTFTAFSSTSWIDITRENESAAFFRVHLCTLIMTLTLVVALCALPQQSRKELLRKLVCECHSTVHALFPIPLTSPLPGPPRCCWSSKIMKICIIIFSLFCPVLPVSSSSSCASLQPRTYMYSIVIEKSLAFHLAASHSEPSSSIARNIHRKHNDNDDDDEIPEEKPSGAAFPHFPLALNFVFVSMLCAAFPGVFSIKDEQTRTPAEKTRSKGRRKEKNGKENHRHREVEALLTTMCTTCTPMVNKEATSERETWPNANGCERSACSKTPPLQVVWGVHGNRKTKKSFVRPRRRRQKSYYSMLVVVWCRSQEWDEGKRSMQEWK